MTLTPSQLRQYRRQREAGVGAKVALQIVRFDARTPKYDFLEGFNEYGNVKGQVAGFDVTVRSVYDEDAHLGDDDVTGTFTDRFEEGCITNTARYYSYAQNGQGSKWYKPSNYDLQYAESEVRASGVAKGRFAEALRERLERAMTEDAGRQYFGVLVTVSFDGEELGTASLWGIDVIPDYSTNAYFQETAEELIEEAIDQAKAELSAAAQRALDHASKLAALEAS